jgi:hypothetical protein
MKNKEVIRRDCLNIAVNLKQTCGDIRNTIEIAKELEDYILGESEEEVPGFLTQYCYRLINPNDGSYTDRYYNGKTNHWSQNVPCPVICGIDPIKK